SILFIIYGFLISLPIAELFLAGIIPGIMMVLAMMTVAYVISRRKKYGTIVPFTVNRVVETTPGAVIGFVAIILSVYGIYAGMFSPTEASAVTVAYCLFAGLLITRETKLAAVPELFFRSGIVVGILGPMVAVSILMQEVLSVIGARQVIGDFLLGFGGYYGVLLGSMILILIGGTLLESVPDTIILAPILAPIAHSVGIDPFHFAVVFLVGDAIGFITPPYGLNLFVASGITNLPYLRITRAALPYLFSLLAVWVVVALVPDLSLFIIQHSGLAAGGSRML
ncbi:MAG: TRAP transporter large permease subunit, partial [Alphaproteobacteria bacterium]|nr:TRAP transporter large permease subunit [Alphaproteobacteria bacterium]